MLQLVPKFANFFLDWLAYKCCQILDWNIVNCDINNVLPKIQHTVTYEAVSIYLLFLL